ncbi:MAG: glycosyltransferase family 2 protein [Candidatus Hadarchaeum sp.]
MMAHNSRRFIAEAIESVLAQDFKDWELLISDDASHDGTGEVVERYLNDQRIHFYRHENNLGQAQNWWFLIQQSSAPVFARLDADDRWYPHTARKMVDAHQGGADVFIGSFVRCYEPTGRQRPGPIIHSGRHTAIEAYRDQARWATALQGATSYKTELARRVGAPLTSLRYMVDYEYVLRLLSASRIVETVTVPLLFYRVHCANETSQAQSTLGYLPERRLLFEACKRHAEWNPGVACALDTLHRSLCAADFSDGLSEAVRGDREKGYRVMREAVERCPYLLRSPRVRVDLMLTSLGAIGYRVLRLLHRRRVLA